MERRPARSGLSRPSLRGNASHHTAPADVSCTAVSNVRITDRAIEETVLLDFLVENAGIRRVSFLLPASMADARLSAPMLREKRVDEVADQPGWVRFSLELQDEIMGRFRVLLESDRLLTDGSHAAPIPLVETGRTDRRYVALENVGRDEVLVERLDSLELLSPRQREWPILISMLGGGAPEAYLVRGEGAEPSLIFGTTRRSAVQTAGARIGLAQATLMLDEHGAFRAVQTFRVDNQTEQYLEIQLPASAALWSASVAGAPIKPIDVAGQPNRVRLPLVRTALGDLDFEVVIKYGGSMDGLGAVDFPLVRTVNINVEMSQVRLFLPEDRLWFGFGGTMRLSEDAGDLEAGYLAYQTRTMQQLLETSRDANVWAKLRASSSLKSLAADVGRQVDAQSLNIAVQQERAAQVAILELAQRQIEEVDSSSEVQTMTDNRRRLNELYEGQRGARARNVVQDLHNFESQIQVQTGITVDEVGRFDSDWIVANELAGETLPMLGEVFKQTEEAGAVPRVDIADRFAPPPGGPPRGGPPPGTPGSGLSRGMGPPVPADRRMQVGAELAENKAPADQERLGRYRQQLADREKETAAVVGQTATRSAGTGGRGFSADAGLGLRSLDVELPTRGREYQFTTPRGEVEITARSLPRSLVRIAVRLALVGLGLILAVALFRVARSWYDRGIDRRWSIRARC